MQKTVIKALFHFARRMSSFPQPRDGKYEWSAQDLELMTQFKEDLIVKYGDKFKPARIHRGKFDDVVGSIPRDNGRRGYFRYTPTEKERLIKQNMNNIKG